MKTQDEIVERIESLKEDMSSNFLGFQTDVLLPFLDYEHAKPYLNDDVTQGKWDENREKRTPKEVMIDYMDFAWEKANDERGISASRSMYHYTGWLWLDGDTTLHPTLLNYNYYGKPQLVKICEYLGLDASKWDDGVRRNSRHE